MTSESRTNNIFEKNSSTYFPISSFFWEALAAGAIFLFDWFHPYFRFEKQLPKNGKKVKRKAIPAGIS